MSENKIEYVSLITEVIAKQAVILGPEIALLKARNVRGLIISPEGKVTDIQADPVQVLQQLIDEYVALSGQIVKNALSSVFAKYPSIKNPE